MQATLKLIIICIASFVIAILFFAWRKEYIICNFKSLNYKALDISCKKKNINLFFWMHERWNQEDIEIIYTDKQEDNIANIVKSWLVLIEEENLIDKKITLLSSLISQNGHELYLSFDRNLIDDEQSTISKLMLIESLLKTLKENTNIKKVRLLKHHQTIWDNHLDLYHGLPVEGFLN